MGRGRGNGALQLADVEEGNGSALNALDGLSLLIDHAGDWDIENVESGGAGFVMFLVEVEVGPDEVVFDGIDDRAVEDLGLEFLSFGVFTTAEYDRERFVSLLGSGGGGFEASVEAWEVVGGASCGFVRNAVEGLIEGGDDQDDGEGKTEEKGDVFHGVEVFGTER